MESEGDHVKTTYKVSGLTAFDGHQPGEEFDADLDEDLEQRAVERGSIEIVKGTPKKKEVKNDG
jgi:hypothetical protein